MSTVTYMVGSWNFFERDWLKIGRTTQISVEDRIRQFQTGSPWPLVAHAVWHGDYEKQLHTRLEVWRGAGEWFRVSRAMLDDMQLVASLLDPWAEFHRLWPRSAVLESVAEEFGQTERYLALKDWRMYEDRESDYITG